MWGGGLRLHREVLEMCVCILQCIVPGCVCVCVEGGSGSNTEVRQTSDNNAAEAKCGGGGERGERRKKSHTDFVLLGW